MLATVEIDRLDVAVDALAAAYQSRLVSQGDDAAAAGHIREVRWW